MKTKNPNAVPIFNTSSIVHLNAGTISQPKSYCHTSGTMTSNRESVTCMDCLELMRINDKI